MKLKWLILPLCLLLILQSCKKDNYRPAPNGSGSGGNTSGQNTIKSFGIDNVLQSNMVVQRNKPCLVWGTSTVGDSIVVKVSWSQTPLNTIADASGNWSVTAPATDANTVPQTIEAADRKKTITLENILIGDVWICSGQSNMVYPMDSIQAPFSGVVNYRQEIAAANYPEIRGLVIQPEYQNNPSDSLMSKDQWQICSPTTISKWSGVAYYFAKKIYTSINVPVGIVVSAVNGTSCEAWTSQATFNLYPAIAGFQGINSSTQLYNAMISPFKKLSVTGYIWYQGENNRYNSPPSLYTTLNSDMILGWRSAFNQGQLPFYFVQLPPFAVDYFSTNPAGGNTTLNDYAKFREAQANILGVPGTGMAVTMDVGVPANQHPPNKKPVGERLALLALKNTYNQNVQCYGPKYLSFTISGNTVTINFVTGTADGLSTINNAPLNQYFFMAGSDQNFVKATATIQGNQILLKIPSGVKLPVQAVRYAFTNAPVTNLQNSAGLPAAPFRTDSWSN